MGSLDVSNTSDEEGWSGSDFWLRVLVRGFVCALPPAMRLKCG